MLNDKQDLWDNSLECFFHRLLNNRLHLIRYVFSGFDYCLIVPGMNNASVRAVQFSGNMDQSQLGTIGSVCLERQTK
ncbi:MAG: hypothetical protein ABSH17_03405 [Syntrophobacteraceae bacterium]|jgi:hypothetical protein